LFRPCWYFAVYVCVRPCVCVCVYMVVLRMRARERVCMCEYALVPVNKSCAALGFSPTRPPDGRFLFSAHAGSALPPSTPSTSAYQPARCARRVRVAGGACSSSRTRILSCSALDAPSRRTCAREGARTAGTNVSQCCTLCSRTTLHSLSFKPKRIVFLCVVGQRRIVPLFSIRSYGTTLFELASAVRENLARLGTGPGRDGGAAGPVRAVG